MRTDAKIGFAIGGVLLAVLTVYAIVVPRHKKSVTTVSLVAPQLAPGSQASDASPSSGETPASSVASSAGTDAASNGMNASSSSSAPVTSTKDSTPPTASASSAAAPNYPSPLGDNIGVSSPSVAVSSPPSNSVSDRTVADGFHPLNAPTDLAKSDDQPSSSGRLIDGIYTPVHSAGKSTRARGTNSQTALPDDGDTTASAVGDTLYTIKPGQTLSKIAYEVYGNSRFWVVIQRENKGLDANYLRVGSKVKLPDISTVVPGPVTVSDEQVSPMTSVDEQAALTPAGSHRHHSAMGGGIVSSDGRTYTVKSGDSLYAIAKRLLGSGRKAAAIYSLNKEVIGPDESKLKLGEVLKLPEGVKSSSAN